MPLLMLLGGVGVIFALHNDSLIWFSIAYAVSALPLLLTAGLLAGTGLGRWTVAGVLFGGLVVWVLGGHGFLPLEPGLTDNGVSALVLMLGLGLLIVTVGTLRNRRYYGTVGGLEHVFALVGAWVNGARGSAARHRDRGDGGALHAELTKAQAEAAGMAREFYDEICVEVRAQERRDPAMTEHLAVLRARGREELQELPDDELWRRFDLALDKRDQTGGASDKKRQQAFAAATLFALVAGDELVARKQM